MLLVRNDSFWDFHQAVSHIIKCLVPFLGPESYILDYKCVGGQDVEKMDYSQELGLWKCALNSPVE